MTSTVSPVTGGIDVGAVPSASDLSPTASPVAAKPAASSTSDSSRVTKLIVLIVSAAVVLGAGGVAGLYLTRHRHDQ